MRAAVLAAYNRLHFIAIHIIIPGSQCNVNYCFGLLRWNVVYVYQPYFIFREVALVSRTTEICSIK